MLVDDQLHRQIAQAVIIAALIAPVIIFFVLPELGPFALIGGLMTALGAATSMRRRGAYDAFEAERALQYHEVKGKTIFVQLVDDYGNELDRATAERKLAEARLNAGPKDTVIGVKRKVNSSS
jgi:hypothetical protein